MFDVYSWSRRKTIVVLVSCLIVYLVTVVLFVLCVTGA